MEDSEVNLQSQADMMGQFESVMDMMHGGSKKKKSTLNTRNILFIVSGSFDKLSDMIKKRVDGSQIGFGADGLTEKPKSEYLEYSTTADFIKYGFEPEFIGRLPIRVTCKELLADDLCKILTESEGSILRQYIEDFEGYNIDLDITFDAIRKIAEKAHKQQTGARGLMTVMERVFRSFKFELPSTNTKFFKVDKDVVEDPEKVLAKLLSKVLEPLPKKIAEELKAFSKDFESKHGFKIEFNKAAANAVYQLSKVTEKPLFDLCNEKFQDYPYGLKLMTEELQNNKFTITAAMVKNPDKALSDRIAKFVKNPA
jgi:ATP-dependent Clp protease ATP-binding subunit ClpX